MRRIIFDRNHEEGATVALPRIVRFAEEKSIPITFALTPQSLKAIQTDLAGFSDGLHLHPEDDALTQRVGPEVKITSDCLAKYPRPDQARLIAAGVEVFHDTVGHAPHFFVAGNWSENTDTLQVLDAAGVRYDGSPLPGYVSACADWGRLPRLAQPYQSSPTDYQATGSRSVLSLPVFQGLWDEYLTPEKLNLLGAGYFKAALKEADVSGAAFVHIYFHSPMALDSYFLERFAEVVDYAQDVAKATFVRPESAQVRQGPTPRPFPVAYYAYLDRPMLKSLLVRRFPAFAPDGRAQRRQLEG